ncbi:unnamed protein product [Schistosoma curassoni]|uniref:C-type lectin domain-containing protein n=1 Tax=Schistosoma curassoni TaxID=6186 RepID=A0A183K9S9_9TREM|nr:unnamed protein product [Schistosoma curassoni]
MERMNSNWKELSGTELDGECWWVAFAPPRGLKDIKNQLLMNQSLSLTKFTNTTYYNKLITNELNDLWKDNLTPVIGRVIWCINESKQKWLYLNKFDNQNINNNITNKKIILINSGKFYCPQPNQSEDMKYCCGPLGKQICCKITDT